MQLFTLAEDNIPLATDSYKQTHHVMYPPGTEVVYSYLEAREGAEHPTTTFFGLQYILMRHLNGCIVDSHMVDVAEKVCQAHFSADLFKRSRWDHIVDVHNGKLPLRIRAVAEGSVVPVGNVLMTVENTCPECFWLTNAMETLLTHVWYPTTVATLSRAVIADILDRLERTAESLDALLFMLHDFGMRGATSLTSAGIGGMAHLVNSRGTDTMPGMLMAMDYYDANLEDLAFSVPATEHSVMTAEGRDGEFTIVNRLLDEFPSGILSVVADSYNIYDFVEALCSQNARDRVKARDGVFVVRPDSKTSQHPTPGPLVVALLERLWEGYGGETNSKGFRVLDSHVRLLWGDGLEPHEIVKILDCVMLHKFSVENLVLGMGGGLLQKVNRDTERFAFKSSAQCREGVWHDIQKQPLDITKMSKKGRLKLIGMNHADGTPDYMTVDERMPGTDLLRTVFEDGEMVETTTFDEVRERASLLALVT